MTRRILLVDDELAILLTLKAILEMNGFEVETATSAREAKQKLSAAASIWSSPICAWRIDLGIRGDPRGAFAGLQSGDGNPDGVSQMGSDWKSEGAESLLVKPMNTNDLLRQIEALLVTHQDSKQERHAGDRRDSFAPRQTGRDSKGSARKTSLIQLERALGLNTQRTW